MLNLVLRLNDSGKILPPAKRSILSDAIALVRAEARQEINIFGFEREDDHFLLLSESLVQDLSNRISKSQQSVEELSASSNVISSWTDWISLHIVSSLREEILSGQVQDSGMVLLLKGLSGRRMAIRVKHRTTILEIKEMYQGLDGVPADQQYLVCRGKKLGDGYCVADYSLRTEDYVHVLLPWC